MLRIVGTDELRPEGVTDLRDLFRLAWGDGSEKFEDDDWNHACGGRHFIVESDHVILAHASVVERTLETNGQPLAAGYVEAVATHPLHQGQGHGSSAMAAVNAYIDERFQLGALGSDRFAFYERLGWVPWGGPTGVRTGGNVMRTPEDDGFVLVRTTPTTPELDHTALITCDMRDGDVW